MNTLAKLEFQKILLQVRKNMAKAFFNGSISKTQKGDTQEMERTYISIIRETLTSMDYKFKEAGSQQPYDFRINLSDGSKLLLEAKKTDSTKIYFNDTCPSEDAFYIIIFTGKEYKNSEIIPKKSIEEIKQEIILEYSKKYSGNTTIKAINKDIKSKGFITNNLTGKKLYLWILQWLKSDGKVTELILEKKENRLPCVFGINGCEFISQESWLVDFKRDLSNLKEKYKNIGINMSVYPRPTYKADINFLFKNYEESRIIKEISLE